MKFNYKPKNILEKFAEKIYFLLVENSRQSFYVGGAVRDMLLGYTLRDIDFATDLQPDEVEKILYAAKIQYDLSHKKLGIVLIPYKNYNLTISTFRKEYYTDCRYPRIDFIKDIQRDSNRRDLTINSLYLSHKDNKILDFHNGLRDIKHQVVKFIGDPAVRIKEDPLRLLRAVRFALDLNFKMEKETKHSLIKYIYLIKSITQNRARQEVLRCRKKINAKILFDIILSKKILDKYSKKF